jgi:hypothetical protein
VSFRVELLLLFAPLDYLVDGRTKLIVQVVLELTVREIVLHFVIERRGGSSSANPLAR